MSVIQTFICILILIKLLKLETKNINSFSWKILQNHPMHVIINTDMQTVLYGSVQSLSCVRLFATPWIVARQASLSKYLVLYIIYQEIKMLSSFFENIACNYIRSFVYFDLTRISHWISPRENENFKQTKLKGFIHLHLVIHHDGWLMRYYKIQTL